MCELVSTVFLNKIKALQCVYRVPAMGVVQMAQQSQQQETSPPGKGTTEWVQIFFVCILVVEAHAVASHVVEVKDHFLIISSWVTSFTHIKIATFMHLAWLEFYWCWTSNPDIDDIYKGEFLFLNTQEWSYCYHRHYAHNGVSMQCPYVHPFSLQFEQLAMFKHCSLHVTFAISWHHRLWHQDTPCSHKCSHLPALDKILLLHPLLCTYSYGAHFVWLLKVHVEVKHTG